MDPFPMNPDQFWTSLDGQILTVKNKDDLTVALTLAFWPRQPAELDFLKSRLAELHFTERSSLARIGIEMLTHGTVREDLYSRSEEKKSELQSRQTLHC